MSIEDEPTPLTADQVERMAWKGMLIDARTDPDNPDAVHPPLGEDEAYVTSLVGECMRYSYYDDKKKEKKDMSLTSIFKTSIGTIVHRTKFFDNAIMEERVNFQGIRGRIDGYDPDRKIIYEVKTTKADMMRKGKPYPHHVAQVLIYWALLYKMKGIIARQAFLLYVSFPNERLRAFEVTFQPKGNQTIEEALEKLWEKTLAKKELLCACRKLGVPPEPTWGTWSTDYCQFNETCVMDSPWHIRAMPCQSEEPIEDAEEMD